MCIYKNIVYVYIYIDNKDDEEEDNEEGERGQGGVVQVRRNKNPRQGTT